MSEGDRRLAALMFTDIVGYTALTQKDESRAMRLLEEQRNIVRSQLPKYSGREIKTIGDAFLIEFTSALDAVKCAYEIQKTLHEFNQNRTLENRVLLRIGIHLGDVLHSQNDVYGDAVNIASRIEGFATPGGICLTEQVYAQIKNKFEQPMSSEGSKSLKNVTDKIELYRVVFPWDEETVSEASILDRHRVAVLPFASLSPDPNDEYFADGLTEELIARLSLLKGLEIIARTSVMNYKKKEKNANQIGRELRAGTLIEGSVRKAGNRIRVTAQLINSNTEGHLWAESYDRTLDDIFLVQSEVAESVATSLHLKLTDLDLKKIDLDQTTSVEAHLEYLKGKVNTQRWDKASLERGIHHFERAIQLDPKYVLAYCGLANVYSKLGFQELLDTRVAYKRSEEFANKALALDENLADCHLALAFAHGGVFTWKREEEFRKAIELNPNLADAHTGLAAIYAFTRQWEKCLLEIDKAVQLDPLSSSTLAGAGTWNLYAGRYDTAIKYFKDSLELDPGDSFCRDNLGLAYIQSGKVEEGLREVKRAVQEAGTTSYYGDLAYAYVRAGQPEQARKLLETLQKPVPGEPPRYTRMAGVYASLGEKEKAIDCLEKAYEARSGYLPSVATDFVYENLRGEPRFEALLEKMGLNPPKSTMP